MASDHGQQSYWLVAGSDVVAEEQCRKCRFLNTFFYTPRLQESGSATAQLSFGITRPPLACPDHPLFKTCDDCLEEAASEKTGTVLRWGKQPKMRCQKCRRSGLQHIHAKLIQLESCVKLKTGISNFHRPSLFLSVINS